jgi:hypothetical protein
MCNISSDSFCYVCGHYVAPKQVKHKIVQGTKFFSAYELYFGMPMGDQDKLWAPHYICGSCRSTLEAWLRGTRKCMPFAIPRIWREPRNHHDDCYFCFFYISKFKGNKQHKSIEYPSVPSSISPMPHSEELPIPKPPQTVEEESPSGDDSNDSEYSSTSITGKTPHFPNQQEMDDLVRDLGLTKSNSELLTSRLRQWNLLDSSCKSSGYKKDI